MAPFFWIWGFLKTKPLSNLILSYFMSTSTQTRWGPLILKLLSLLKQLKSWTKGMEQWVSDTGQQAVKDKAPWERKNKGSPAVSQNDVREEFPGHRTGRRRPRQSLPELGDAVGRFRNPRQLQFTEPDVSEHRPVQREKTADVFRGFPWNLWPNTD